MQVASTKETLEQQIISCEQGYITQRDLASGALHTAVDAHAKYQENRATGGRKIGRIAQNFFTQFSDFIRAYSGIIELLRSAGQVYGDVAYGTLSIFLIVRRSLPLSKFTKYNRYLSIKVVMIRKCQTSWMDFVNRSLS